MSWRFDRAVLPAIATVVLLLTLPPSHAAPADSQATIFAEAIAAARQIDDAEQKVFALCEVADAQASAKLTDDARRTLAEAFKIAVDLDYAESNSAGMDERARPLWSIAVYQADAGFFAEALATAQKIASPRGKADALFMVASAQAQAGLFADALSAAHKIANKAQKSNALSNLAGAQTKAGRYGAALSTVRELEFQDMRAMRLREIAVAQAKAGQPDQAREIFAEMLATALGIKEGSQPDKAKPIYDVAVSQAEAGLSTDALETARQIEDDTKFRISALCRIAAVQAKANEAEQARRTVSEAIGIARKIKGASERLSALSEIGRTQAEAGQSEHACRTLAEAIALARAIKAGDVSLLVALASAQADCGQTEPARKTTTEAVAIARRMSDEDRLSRAYVIAEIALAQARAGFLTEALATADEIQAASVLMQNFRGSAIGDAFSIKMATLRQISEIYAQKGNFTEALTTARRIEERPRRASVEYAIGAMQQGAGQRDQARQTFAEALATAREAIANPGRANGPFSPSGIIVDAQLQTGQFADAISVGRLLETAEQRGRTLGEIAAAMVKAGQAKQAAETLTEALAALRKDNDTGEKAANLAMIAATQAKAGLIEQAHQTFAEAVASARNLKYPDFSDDGNSALTQVATSQRNAGFLSDALASARAIKYPGEKASALTEIAGEQFAAGQRDQAAQPLAEAIAAAHAMEDEDGRGGALQGIVEVQVKAGFLDAGLSMARDIENPHSKACALLAVASAQAHGELKQRAPQTFTEALAAARRITDPNQKQFVLRDIAVAQREAGLNGGAGQTLAEALAEARELVTKGQECPAPSELSVLCEIATQQVALGSIGAALATAAEIKDTRSKVSTLCEIAAAQSKAGQPTEAERSFREAFLAASQDCREMRDVARAQAAAGLRQQAENSLNQALVAARKLAGSGAVSALCAIADTQTQAGLKEQGRRTFSEAFAAAQQSGDANQFREVAWSQDYAGLSDEAVATARAMKDSIEKVDVLSNLPFGSYRQTDQAKLDQARDCLREAMIVARRIANAAEKQKAFHLIMTRITQPERNADFYAEPLDLARKIEDAWEKANALCTIAAAQARAGLMEQARQTFAESLAAARQINDEPAESDSPDDAGSRTAAAISNIALEVPDGLLPEALLAARQIDDPRTKASSLCAIAAAWAEKPEK